MCNSRVLVCVVGLSLMLWAGSASGALVNYWSCDAADAVGVGGTDVGDTIGGKTGVATGWWGSTDPSVRVPGATGVANSAAEVYSDAAVDNGGYLTQLLTLGTGTNFTFEAMFRFDSYGYRHGYLVWRGGGPIELNFRPEYGAYNVTAAIGGTFLFATNPVYALTAGTWYDIALTYDGTTASLYVTPYSPTATANLLQSVTMPGLTATHATQGLGLGTGDDGKYGIDGAFDWAAVSNTALTPAEITTNIQRNSPIPEPATMGLLALGACLPLLRRRR